VDPGEKDSNDGIFVHGHAWVIHFSRFFGHASNCALFEKAHLNRNKANAIILYLMTYLKV
jgi:hypothetical protein